MSQPLKVLDLFAGLGGWSAAFTARGHQVTTVDLNPAFGCTITADILTLQYKTLWKPGDFDVVLASPPCEGFSVASIGRHWTPPPANQPKTATALLAVQLVNAALDIIKYLEPAWWVMENPRGKLRSLNLMTSYPRQTVTYCQLGEKRMKPTDLWGKFPRSLVLPLPCKNGDLCHDRAPRGAKTGTQGIKGSANRAVVPYQLSWLVCQACEIDFVRMMQLAHGIIV